MKFNFLFLFISFPIQASLFLTPEEKKYTSPTFTPPKQQTSFRLKAIFYRPDLNYWIVWINDARIDSRHPISIDGWTVTHVTMNSVKLTYLKGQEQELFLTLE